LPNARAGSLDLRARLPAFLLGFLATSFQIFLLREFAVHFYGNELTFGLVLGAWLLWGGIGSLLGPRFRLQSNHLPLFYTATIGLYFSSLALLRFSHRLLGGLPGELTGLVPALLFSLVLALLVSFPLGVAFVVNASFLNGDASKVYQLESLGAAAAGLAVHLLLIPNFSNWAGAALVSVFAGLLIFLAMRPARAWGLLLATLAASVLFSAADFPSLRLAWQPFNLVEAKDTPYGKLQVLRTEDQYSLYSNGLPVFSYPNAEAAEESVHFAMLQRAGRKDILLIGGGVSGGCAECLKYPETRVDYVEIDPGIIRLAERYLPEPGLSALKDARVKIIFEDGRAFLERTKKVYDAIILSLPEPATAQINRFYTREFFGEVRKKLVPSGVFSFVVPSAENYISEDLERFLATLDTTLKGVFPEVLAVPGETNVFLASDTPLSIDPDRLVTTMERLGIRNRYVSRQMLPARLSPLRIDYLARKIQGRPGLVNRDLIPVSYYFHSVLWASQFRGVESAFLRFFARVPAFWVLDFPLVIATLGLAFMALKRRGSSARLLVPLALVGFSSILVEIAVLLVYQAFHGYVYGKISLLLSAFMAGLFAGSTAGRWKKRPGETDLAATLAASAGLLLLGQIMVERPGPEILPFLFLFAFGALGGFLFVNANRLYLEKVRHPGMGYGIDLLGSFLSVILASSIVIPLLGIPRLLGRLAVLNVLGCLFVLAVTVRRRKNFVGRRAS
jgi:spermidine synthase